MAAEQEPTKRSTGRTQPARADGLLDLNVLPQRHRRPRLRWASVAPWLSLLGLLVLVYPTFQWFLATNQAYGAVAREVGHLQATQIALQAPSGTEAAMSTQISSVQDQAQQLRAAASMVNIQNVAWGQTVNFILGNAPAGLTVIGVAQNGDTLAVTGDASTYQVPLAYAQRLQASERFVSVTVAVINRKPTAMPTTAPASTTEENLTASPTPEAPFTFTMSIVTESSNLPTPVAEDSNAN
jgi:hypothetical protein